MFCNIDGNFDLEEKPSYRHVPLTQIIESPKRKNHATVIKRTGTYLIPQIPVSEKIIRTGNQLEKQTKFWADLNLREQNLLETHRQNMLNKKPSFLLQVDHRNSKWAHKKQSRSMSYRDISDELKRALAKKGVKYQDGKLNYKKLGKIGQDTAIMEELDDLLIQWP